MSRRRWLGYVAAATAAPAGMSGWLSQALAAGSLGGVEGVAKLEGNATVNGAPAKVGTPVKPGDRVVTGKASQAVVVVGSDAFLLRGETAIETSGAGGLVTAITVANGKLLAVFGKKELSIKTGPAAIGIRGTGAYLEVEPQRVYFCLCYGEAVIDGRNMPAKVVKTEHHESPLYLLDDGTALRAEPGPFLNHSDAELVMLEALVGREPPFVKNGVYPSKRY
ncbi:hypothetical protein BWI17_04850 [Betaproteobacteria bacterium GR16-43]|nr:hypothetical protein BWI17_04850 [Betaproteobacteria bacterium GR16-43]